MADVVIAVDPGTVDTGICLGIDGQVLGTAKLHVPANWLPLDRIIVMVQKLNDYFNETCRFEGGLLHPTSLAYEQPGTFQTQDIFEQKGMPIIALHQLVAVIEFWARANKIQTYPYNVNLVKEGVAGSRRASKKDVQFIMRKEYGWEEVQISDHEWDALSVYTYHLRQRAIAASTI